MSNIISKQIKTVYNIIPAPIFYVKKIPFKPAWKGGMVYGPVVFIMEKYKDDTALLQHELWHVKQFWMTLGFHIPLYSFNIFNYKLWSEVKGYNIQWLALGKKYEQQLAKNLSTMYNLNVTEDYARNCIISGRII